MSTFLKTLTVVLALKEGRYAVPKTWQMRCCHQNYLGICNCIQEQLFSMTVLEEEINQHLMAMLCGKSELKGNKVKYYFLIEFDCF